MRGWVIERTYRLLCREGRVIFGMMVEMEGEICLRSEPHLDDWGRIVGKERRRGVSHCVLVAVDVGEHADGGTVPDATSSKAPAVVPCKFAYGMKLVDAPPPVLKTSYFDLDEWAPL